MLYFLFVMAMMIHVVLALLFFMIIWRIVVGDLTDFVWFWIVFIIPSYFILTVFYQYNKIIHNHDWLLKDLSVKRLFVNVSGIETNHSTNHHLVTVQHIKDFPSAYRRYYEFAEQLAIASNIVLPKLYVMDDNAINAFVAGFDNNHMMLVVSEGALKLDNESLYGLIGHEYGHILHGDAKLNVKMYVLMSGLSWLYDVADGLEWASKWRQTPKVNRYYIKDEHGHRREYVSVTGIGRLSIEFLSLLIRLVGFLGMVSSEWIKQHFNHQREFLADATSVQLTRSDGVAKLLKTLQQNPYLTKSKKHYTTHLSYFFFLNPNDANNHTNWRTWASHLGSTHPSNKARIVALNEHHYDDFAQMAINHLNPDKLKHTHDLMMCVDMDDIVQTVAINHEHSSDDVDDKPTDKIIVPIYEHDIELSQDKVINGRLVTDESWKNLGKSDVIFYPKQAKPDHELKEVKYVNTHHIKNMHLPLLITRFLHNNALNHHDLTGLFALFYAVMICHDKQLLNIDDVIYFHDIFGMENSSDHDVVKLDRELLVEIAKLDRRVDNGLLLMIYGRIKQDLNHDEKSEFLMNDFYHLNHLIKNSYGKNTNTDKLSILWQGVHLYRLLSLCDVDGVKYQSLFDELCILNHDDKITMNEWVVIVLLIKIIISHHHDDHDKNLHAIYRHIRLLNHEIILHQSDIEKLMAIIHSLNAVDIALLLSKYHEHNSLISKRYIDTLHTALLGNGEFYERDYEILLVLYDGWCPNHEFLPID